MPTRRALLLGGAGAVTAGLVGAGVGVQQGVLPGRPWLQAQLGLDGEDGVVPDIEPGPVEEGSFLSEARGGVDTGWSVVWPPGDRPTACAVALHGLGADHTWLTSPALALDRYLAAHVGSGGTPFAFVTADGGRTFWHPRPDGEDASRMVTDELLPLAAGRGLDVSRFGLIGWSMGGYGALRLAGLLGPDRVTAVVACSPALWSDPEDAWSEGFADAEEYERGGVFGRQGDLAGVPVRVDIGTGDIFYSDVRDYVAGFPDDVDVVSTFEAGGHTDGYWRRMLPAQLGFLGEAFA